MDGMPKEAAVEVRLKKTLEDSELAKSQSKSAALVVAQYLRVLEGLRGRVPAAYLFTVAATLTTGIRAESSGE